MIYEYECQNGHHFERVMPVSDYDKPQVCDCGSPGHKIITRAPFGIVQGPCVYDSPIDGRIISSWAERRDDLARHGCQPYDPEMKRDAETYRRRQDEALDRSVDATVEAAFEKMPARQKEQLSNELTRGASADIVRSTKG